MHGKDRVFTQYSPSQGILNDDANGRLARRGRQIIMTCRQKRQRSIGPVAVGAAVGAAVATAAGAAIRAAVMRRAGAGPAAPVSRAGSFAGLQAT